MAKQKLPHLQEERTRHGRRVWYVRVNRGPRIRIPGEYGSPEFMSAYRAAFDGERPQSQKNVARTGSLRWLVSEWKRSFDWARTSASTRKQRDSISLHVLKTAGCPLRSCP